MVCNCSLCMAHDNLCSPAIYLPSPNDWSYDALPSSFLASFNFRTAFIMSSCRKHDVQMLANPETIHARLSYASSLVEEIRA